MSTDSESLNLLSIWAILGPLLTAGITQLWNQYVKGQDRKFNFIQKKHEIEELTKSEIDKNRRLRLKEKHDKTQEAYINFLSYSHQLFSICLYSPLDVNDSIQHELYNSFIQAHQKVMLIGSNEIAVQAAVSFNATDAAIRKAQDSEREYKLKLHEAYRSSLGDFQISARLHLEGILEN